MEWFKSLFKSVKEFFFPVHIDGLVIHLETKLHFDKPLVCYLFTEKYGVVSLVEQTRVKKNELFQEVVFEVKFPQPYQMKQLVNAVIKIYDIDNTPVDKIKNFRMICL